MINSYKDLIVWQKGVGLTKEIYTLTRKFPVEERFGLVSQMRRSAVSVPSNIAEGRGRTSRKDFVHFLRIANGSAMELETQVIIAKDIYSKIDFSKAENLLIEIQKMLSVMIKKLNEAKS